MDMIKRIFLRETFAGYWPEIIYHWTVVMVTTGGFWVSDVPLSMLQNCPITNDDIKNVHDIFGSDISHIRGKTMCRKPDRVDTDYVEIPRAL